MQLMQNHMYIIKWHEISSSTATEILHSQWFYQIHIYIRETTNYWMEGAMQLNQQMKSVQNLLRKPLVGCPSSTFFKRTTICSENIWINDSIVHLLELYVYFTCPIFIRPSHECIFKLWSHPSVIHLNDICVKECQVLLTYLSFFTKKWIFENINVWCIEHDLVLLKELEFILYSL